MRPETRVSPSGPAEPGLSMEELRRRICVAGVLIPEERLEMVRKLVGEALAPLRALDSRGVRTLEPAVTFVANAFPGGGGKKDDPGLPGPGGGHAR